MPCNAKLGLINEKQAVYQHAEITLTATKATKNKALMNKANDLFARVVQPVLNRKKVCQRMPAQSQQTTDEIPMHTRRQSDKHLSH
jgi:hypothetical protein